MSNRPVRRAIAHDEALLQQLNQAGFSALKCKDVLGKQELELVFQLDLPQPIVRKLVHSVSKAVAPQAATAWDLRQTNSEHGRHLRTTLPGLDRVLHGGIPSGSITEIVGPAGVGKTQFCHQLATLACLPQEKGGLDGRVAYFDAESCFSAERLVDIVTERFPEYSEESNIHTLLTPLVERVVLYKVSTLNEFFQELQNLEEAIIEHRCKLIILDSIAALARRDFDEANMAKRQALLSQVASSLKRLAERFSIPVVVTNQVTTRIGGTPNFEFVNTTSFDVFSGSGPQNVTAALGTLWAHAVNNRLVLEYSNNHHRRFVLQEQNEEERAAVRRLIVAKSPISPVVSFCYRITNVGLVQVRLDGEERSKEGKGGDGEEERMEEEEATMMNAAEVTNFWTGHITDRSSASALPGGSLNEQQHFALFNTDLSF
ncbi:DNA repair protein RAD51 [Balamuthia mandrillaris]